MRQTTPKPPVRFSSIVAICLTLAACATTSSIDDVSSVSAPSNYQQIVASKLKGLEKVSTIQSAEITPPHDKFMGLIAGGTRQVVCVRVVRPSILGNLGRFHYIFYFKDGRVEDYRYGSTNVVDQMLMECRDQSFSDFTKLVRT